MKIIPLLSIFSFVLVFFVSCTTTSPVVQEQSSDHPHYFSRAQNAGDYHVVNFMKQKAAKIGIQILDRLEEPYYLDVAKIRAVVTRQKGEKETVWLKGEGYKPQIWPGENLGSGATVFSVQLPWVQEEHTANLQVWVPLPDGKLYELTFDCEALNPLPKQIHSGLYQN